MEHFLNDGPKHIKLTTVDIWVVYFTYTLTDTCMHIIHCMYIDYTVKPVLSGYAKKEDQLSLNGGQKYCRMLQGEHFAMLSTFIKLPFVFFFFEWLLKTCFTVLTTYMYVVFCGVSRLAVR